VRRRPYKLRVSPALERALYCCGVVRSVAKHQMLEQVREAICPLDLVADLSDDVKRDDVRIIVGR